MSLSNFKVGLAHLIQFGNWVDKHCYHQSLPSHHSMYIYHRNVFSSLFHKGVFFTCQVYFNFYRN